MGLDILGFILDIGAQTGISRTVYSPAAVDGSHGDRSVPINRVSVGITLGVNVPF
jgi:hypothetical protein